MATSSTRKLTEAMVQRTHCTNGDRKAIADAILPGLVLRITPRTLRPSR